MYPGPFPKQHYEPLNLEVFPTFEEKLIALCDYIKIQAVFCEIANKEALQDRIPLERLHVISLAVLPWHFSYAKTTLTEKLVFFTIEAKKYLQSEDEYEGIADSLQRCIDLCSNARNKNNLNDHFSSDREVNFYAYWNDHPLSMPFQCFSFDRNALLDLEEHFSIRKGFYEQMIEMLSKALIWHKERPIPSKKPYSLDSLNPELDVSEVLYTLYRVSKQLLIDFDAGGSFPKFKKDFFGLFGLSDKDYDKKIIQIQKRKRGDDFIRDMANKLEDSRDMPNYDTQ